MNSSPRTRSLRRWALALVPLALQGAGCAPADSTDNARAALSAEQCDFFDENGRVTICHATGSTRNPITVLRVSTSACVNAHSNHAGDRIAPDGDCGPTACLPATAPYDGTVRCCDGLVVRDGRCVDLCANVTCSASDQCHAAGACDPGTGACSDPAAPDGATCDDGDACTAGDVCTAGACGGAAVSTDDGNPCTADACSPSGGVTHAPVADGTSCGAGLACASGACVSVCSPGYADCGGACADLQSDAGNCGACGLACAAGQTCAAGACVTVCAPGTAQCGSECVAAPTNFYPADGNANDVAGGQSATYSNALYAAGRRGQAFSYSSGRYTALPSSVGNFGGSNFTISLWFNTTAAGNILSKRSACWNGPGFTGEDLRLGSNGVLGIELWSSAMYTGFGAGVGLNNGQWHHVAIVREPGVVRAYIDGALAASTAFTGSMSDPSNTPTYIGVGRCVAGAPGWNGTSDGTAWFNGRVDDLGFYSYAMSPQQVQQAAQALCTP